MVFPVALRAAAAASGLVLLTGCGATQPADPDASAAPSAPSSPTSTDPGDTSSGNTPVSPSASVGTGRGLATRLLAASDLPGLNAAFHWTQKHTKPAGSDSFGVCQQFDLVTIGAKRVIQRDFTGPGGATAAEQLAVFPDRMTAVRAGKVLEAWHRACAAKMHRGKNFRVGALTSVPVAVGTASWYVTSWATGADSGHFQAFGIASNDTRIALLTMDNDGQDRNYARGKEPMIGAVKAAADRLG